jgi:hypothetical protein
MGEATTNGSVPSHERVEPGSVNIPLGEFPATSTSDSVDSNKIAQEIMNSFNDGLSKKDYASIAGLFLEEKSYWRDHLALSWELRTIKGRNQIISYLNSSKVRLTKVEIDSMSSFRQPHFGPIDAWGDVKGIQFFIRFESETGRGEGIVSLAEEDNVWKIFTFSTVLKELKGHEEAVGKRRTKGVEHGGHPERKNWAEKRDAEVDFTDADPKVLIIGAYSFRIPLSSSNSSC